MNSAKHLLLGGAVGVAPDLMLVFFGWRNHWLEPDHPLVRAHRFLHSPGSIPVIAALAWGSHLLADHYSHHNYGP